MSPDLTPSRPVIELADVSKSFRTRGGGEVKAVRGVSMRIEPGECRALIGESGSGKTTIAKLTIGLETPDQGTIRIGDRDLSLASAKGLRSLRRSVTHVFQEPFESLNPKRRVATNIEMPLRIHEPWLSKAERARRVREIAAAVRLEANLLDRYPHQLSGGQQQRVGIARALVTDPAVVVLDEPTSALDASVRGGILRLLKDLQVTRRLTYLLITHDMTTVSVLADRVGVLLRGCLIEEGTREDILERPSHPYTRLLIDSVLRVPGAAGPEAGAPEAHADRAAPAPARPLAVAVDQPACPFVPRCPHASDQCATGPIPDEVVGEGHAVRCVHPQPPTSTGTRAARVPLDVHP